MINIEQNLREICKRKGLKLSDIADRIGTGQSNLITSLKGNPTISKLEAVAAALQVSLAELLTMRPEKAQGVVMIDGQVYQVSRPSANVVQLPVYERYSDFREDIKEFVSNSIESEENRSLIAMLETFEVFCLCYDARNNFFSVSLCYSDGKTMTFLYDKLEYCNWRDNDTEETVRWDINAITKELITDIEESVPQKLEELAK